MMEEGWVAVGVWVREWWKGGGFVEVGRGWGGVGGGECEGAYVVSGGSLGLLACGLIL